MLTTNYEQGSFFFNSLNCHLILFAHTNSQTLHMRRSTTGKHFVKNILKQPLNHFNFKPKIGKILYHDKMIHWQFVIPPETIVSINSCPVIKLFPLRNKWESLKKKQNVEDNIHLFKIVQLPKCILH